MSHLDKEVLQACYDELHDAIGHYMRLNQHEEAFEAVVLLASTAISARCIYLKSNVEQTMEETFNDIADYVYEWLEDDLEVEEN